MAKKRARGGTRARSAQRPEPRGARGEDRSTTREGGGSARGGDAARGGLLEWVKSFAIAFALFLVIRTFLLQTFTITSGSMEGTLLVGDFLMLSKVTYGATVPWTSMRLPGYDEPARGDVIVFRGPHEPDLDLVKRLIGLPGDTLEMRERVLYVNGAPREESYARPGESGGDVMHPSMRWQAEYLPAGISPEGYRPSLYNWGPIVVPPGKYFVLGDNRDDSLDSRYWGLVDHTKVKGRTMFIYFSYDPRSPRPFPWIRDVRWGRIGSWIR